MEESERRSAAGFPWALIVILGVFLVYAGLFIFKTSFVIEGERYFSLFDDAMVSMRYARNLASGNGLVWNAGGERVEGFTTPLWTLYMAVLHLLPIPAAKISLLVQITGALCLFVNLLIVTQIARVVAGGDPRITVGSVLLVAFCYPLNNWALQGMEVGLLALAISTATLVSLKGLESGRVSRWLYVLLGLLTLIRMDAGLVAFAILVFLAVVQPSERRRHLVEGFGCVGVVLIAQTVARWSYYGDFVPNTYYLKMTSFPVLERIGYGFQVLWGRLVQLNWFLCLFPFLGVAMHRRRDLILLTWLILCQVAFSVYVGGDAWEWLGTNRYLAVVIPLFFVLFAYSLVSILDRAARFLRRPSPAAWAVAPLFILALIRFNVVGEAYTLSKLALLSSPPLVSHNEQMTRRARALSKVTLPEAKLAVVWGGAIPYFADRPCVDLLGKSDRKIAREQMHRGVFLPFYPGHMKRDYSYSIGKLEPDIVVQLWVHPEEAEKWLEADYVGAQVSDYCFCVRKGSPYILWSKLTIPPAKCLSGPPCSFTRFERTETGE